MALALNIVSCTKTPTKHQQCLHPKDTAFNLSYAAGKETDLERERRGLANMLFFPV